MPRKQPLKICVKKTETYKTSQADMRALTWKVNIPVNIDNHPKSNFDMYTKPSIRIGNSPEEVSLVSLSSVHNKHTPGVFSSGCVILKPTLRRAGGGPGCHDHPTQFSRPRGNQPTDTPPAVPIQTCMRAIFISVQQHQR